MDNMKKALTTAQVEKMMSNIRIGDQVDFDSVGACNKPSQLARHKTTIPAVGKVVVTNPCYVVVELKSGIREGVRWDDIKRLNGKNWPLYCKPMEE